MKYEGIIDSFDSKSVGGWVWDPTSPEKRITVRAFLDDVCVGEVLAEEFRDDLRTRNVGDGFYGFRLNLGHPSRHNAKLEVIAGEDSEAVKLVHMAASTSSSIQGSIELLGNRGAEGWAWDPTAPDHRLKIHAILRNQVIGATTADKYLVGLEEFGAGDCKYGLSVVFDKPIPWGAMPSFLAYTSDGRSVNITDVRHAGLKGSIDNLNPNFVSGWAWWAKAPEERLIVRAIEDGNIIGSSVASDYRADLVSPGIRDGLQSFSINLTLPIRDMSNVSFVVFNQNGHALGKLSHYQKNKIKTKTNTSISGHIDGHIDSIRRDGASGWAWLPSNPEKRLMVEAVSEGKTIAAGIANHFRPDLLDEFKGDGNLGFELVFSPALDEDQQLPEIRVVGRSQSISSASLHILRETLDNDQLHIEDHQAEIHFDYLDTAQIRGWAWYPEAPEKTIELELISNDKVLEKVVADGERRDLQEAGIGTGRYGYQLSIDALSQEDYRSTVIRTDKGQTVEFPMDLLNSSELPQTEIYLKSKTEGSIDYINRTFAIGWACFPDSPEHNVTVEAIIGDRVVGRAIANEPREDLLQWGKPLLCGFTLHFDNMIFGEETPKFRVLPAKEELLENNNSLPPLSKEERNLEKNTSTFRFFDEHSKYTTEGPDFEELNEKILDNNYTSSLDVEPLVMAYYLPQFHSIVENDEFWGKGFTEWRQLAKGLPRFPGHYQPRTPRDLGFYSLDSVETLEKQANLAKKMGINAFCYYYYWFNTKRVLEKPLNAHLVSNIDMPFLLMWANENWTRTWDGSESSILLQQDYRIEDENLLIADFARHFKDERYVRIRDRPLLFIYNPKHLPDGKNTISRWREKFFEKHGLEPLIYMAQTFELTDPRPFGLDGAIEFPPHKLTQNLPGRITPDAFYEGFKSRVVRYDDVVRASIDEEACDYPLIKTLVPSWDNDSRRPGRGLLLEKSSPNKYQLWLVELLRRAIRRPIDDVPIVAINAWNEWAEGAYLEPDVYYGSAYLNATARAVQQVKTDFVSDSTSVSGKDISVILPCYNHASYLRERLDSIINQTLKPAEIIFLDDASSDESVEVAEQILKNCDIPWRIEKNTENAGCVFKQWIKGIDLAQHDIIWIAETDDTAARDFLDKISNMFDRDEILGAFGHIRCIDPQGNELADLDNYYDDFQDHSWVTSSITPAAKSFENDFSIRNIVPNASGFVFRKPVLTSHERNRLYSYQFAGDWYFYSLILRGGSLAYVREAKSFFRVNPGSASRSAFFSERHLEEHRMILQDIAMEYGVNQKILARHADLLHEHFPALSYDKVLEKITPCKAERKMRICIAAHSFSIGGGELVPLGIANELRKRGHHVTYLVVEDTKSDKSLRKRLRPDIPVVYFDDVARDFQNFVKDFGLDLINSHNVSIDHRLYSHSININCPYICSLHGSYETVPDLLTPEYLHYLEELVDVWLPLSEKNTEIFQKNGLEIGNIIQSFNAVSPEGIDWVDRSDFRKMHGIPEDAFVLFVCSRAIESKGWSTAIKVRELLDANSERAVHLVLIGDGPDLDKIRRDAGNCGHVHFLGHLDTPIRTFCAFDFAIFPSTYAGETFPVFLLECLAAGIPIATTDIGDIPRIMGEGSSRPGGLVDVRKSEFQKIEEFGKIISPSINSISEYQRLANLATKRSAHFEVDNLIDLYIKSYLSAIEISSEFNANSQTRRGRV